MANKIDEAQTEVEETEKNIGEFVSELKTKLVSAEEQVVQYAKNNPLKALGFAVLTGVIAAQLFRHKK